MKYSLFKHQQASINAIRHHSDIPYIFLIGGFGCGKSTTDVELLLFLLHAYLGSAEPITIGLLGVTIKLLTQTVIADFERALDAAGIIYKDNAQKGTITIGNVTIIYLAMQNPDDIYAFNFHCAICDEIDEVPPERVKAITTAIQERCRKVMPAGRDMPSRDPFIFFSTTAQGLGGTYQLIRYFQKQGVPYIKIRGRTEDNTSLARTQIETLRRLYSEDEAKAYLDGEFMNLSSGRVYPEFDQKKHRYMSFPVKEGTPCVPGEEPAAFEVQEGLWYTGGDTIYIGADFNSGYNMNVAIIERAGKMYIIDEFHWKYMGEAPLGLRERWPYNKIVFIPDASGKEIMSGFAEEFGRNRIEVYWNSKNPSVSERITAVNKALAWGQLYVFENCERCILSLETRDFDDTGKPRKGKGIDAPDHVADSLEYGVWRIVHGVRGYDKILDAIRITHHNREGLNIWT